MTRKCNGGELCVMNDQLCLCQRLSARAPYGNCWSRWSLNLIIVNKHHITRSTPQSKLFLLKLRNSLKSSYLHTPSSSETNFRFFPLSSKPHQIQSRTVKKKKKISFFSSLSPKWLTTTYPKRPFNLDLSPMKPTFSRFGDQNCTRWMITVVPKTCLQSVISWLLEPVMLVSQLHTISSRTGQTRLLSFCLKPVKPARAPLLAMVGTKSWSIEGQHGKPSLISILSRPGGHVRPEIYYSMPTYIKRYGQEMAAAISNFEISHIQTLKDLIEKEQIDCDFTLGRSMDVFLDEAHAVEAKAAFDTLKKSGLVSLKDVQYTSTKNAEIVSISFLRSVLFIPSW